MEQGKYDVFISCNSVDYSKARDVNRFLTDHKYSTFFAEAEIPKTGDSKFKNVIDVALENATHFILVTTNKEHLKSEWVDYEWNTFQNEKLSGRKDGNIITILGDDITIDQLPIALRAYQSLPLSSYQETLRSFLPKSSSDTKLQSPSDNDYPHKTNSFNKKGCTITLSIVLTLLFIILPVGIFFHQEYSLRQQSLEKQISYQKSIESSIEKQIETSQIEELGSCKPDIGSCKPNIPDYYPYIYRIIIDDIKLQYGVETHDAGIATKNIECGTGFILSNGNFITARQNIQPWINVNGISITGWRERLAKAIAMGFDVIIHFSAYSTNGPSSKITFSSYDFDLPEAGDIVSATYTIDKNDWIIYKTLGFPITKEDMKRTGRDFKVTTSSNRAYAIYRNTGYPGLPINNGIAQSIAGGEEIKICGYTSNNIHHLSAAANYFMTRIKNTQANNFFLQDSPHEIGYLGAPAFIEKNGILQVVGVYAGQGRLVSISSCR